VAQYRKGDDDSFVADHELPSVPVRDLRAMFDVGDDRDVVLCYPITSEQKPFFEHALGKRLQLGRFDYFLEAYATPSTVTARNSHAPSNRVSRRRSLAH